jgi:hypothetical protein
MYSISGLGSTETFISHPNNALKKAVAQATATHISVELAPLSVNTITMQSLVTGSKPTLQKNTFKATVYPNPANEQTVLNFSIPEKSRMNVAVFNSNGQILETIINSVFEAGNHQLNLDSSRYPDGIYWIRFNSETNVETIKLIKTKNQ